MTPYKTKKECYLPKSYLADTRRLLFMVEQVFLLMGEVWSMYNAGTQCTIVGREGPKAEKIFYV